MPLRKIFADVKWWDECLVTLSCPVCDRLHTHGFGISYDNTSRSAHCAHSHETPRLTYDFRYPFSQDSGSTAYEIDKPKNKRYVSLGVEPPPGPDNDALAEDLAHLDLEEASAASEPRLRLLWAEATEDITIDLTDDVFRKLHNAFGGEKTFKMKRLDHVKSRILLYGDTEYLRSFLDSSPDADAARLARRL
jgi:hypothetical protein